MHIDTCIFTVFLIYYFNTTSKHNIFKCPKNYCTTKFIFYAVFLYHEILCVVDSVTFFN